jgi:hypothetical protein
MKKTNQILILFAVLALACASSFADDKKVGEGISSGAACKTADCKDENGSSRQCKAGEAPGAATAGAPVAGGATAPDAPKK